MDPELLLQRLLDVAEERKPTDIFLLPGGVHLKIRDSLVRLEHAHLTDQDVRDVLTILVGDATALESNVELDVSYLADNRSIAGFRVNAFKSMGRLSAVLRVIERNIKGFASLGIPIEVQITLETLCKQQREGLILIAGETGSGKSSTLRAMVSHINETRDAHILWIDDPHEIILKNRKSIITQREVRRDTRDWVSALEAGLRQSADIIVLGEIRPKEVMDVALQACQTGHLVLATYHGGNTIDVFKRVLADFTKSQVLGAIKAVIVQQLFPRADGGDGRVPALEIVLVNSDIEKIIMEDKWHELPQLIERNTNQGMQTMKIAVERLATRNKISWDIARRYTGS